MSAQIQVGNIVIHSVPFSIDFNIYARICMLKCAIRLIIRDDHSGWVV